MHDIFLKFGNCARIKCDNGLEFEGKSIQNFRTGVQVRYSSPYYPQANGLCERANRSLNK